MFQKNEPMWGRGLESFMEKMYVSPYCKEMKPALRKKALLMMHETHPRPTDSANGKWNLWQFACMFLGTISGWRDCWTSPPWKRRRMGEGTSMAVGLSSWVPHSVRFLSGDLHQQCWDQKSGCCHRVRQSLVPETQVGSHGERFYWVFGDCTERDMTRLSVLLLRARSVTRRPAKLQAA